MHKCDECDQIFIAPFELKEHRKTHSKQPMDAGLNRHKKENEPADNKNKSSQNQTQNNKAEQSDGQASNKRYTCEKCDKVFSSKSGLHHHRYKHTGERRFKCPLCATT